MNKVKAITWFAIAIISIVIWSTIFSLILSGCVGTKPTIGSNGLIKLSNDEDYIRPIKTPVGYYYNSPKNRKIIKHKN